MKKAEFLIDDRYRNTSLFMFIAKKPSEAHCNKKRCGANRENCNAKYFLCIKGSKFGVNCYCLGGLIVKNKNLRF